MVIFLAVIGIMSAFASFAFQTVARGTAIADNVTRTIIAVVVSWLFYLMSGGVAAMVLIKTGAYAELHGASIILAMIILGVWLALDTGDRFKLLKEQRGLKAALM